MATFVVRLWLPDRPGALGAVAGRIGAVRGDLTGIDILERGGGSAIDELVIELPDPSLVPLLLNELAEVDGVKVEDVRPAPEHLGDPRLDALLTAAVLVGQESTTALLSALVDHAGADFDADWVAVVAPEASSPLVTSGAPPPFAWLTAFLAGSRSAHESTGADAGPDDVAWAELEVAGLAVVLGRQGRPLRTRERRQLQALALIADARWSELGLRRSLVDHPSIA
ncbi:MAG: hypothetical protein QOG03_2408 [Actinomycetota bacterium]|jgi:hypothetical protein|nr:hypothetical protein [Actinomycetota bacterium]